MPKKPSQVNTPQKDPTIERLSSRFLDMFTASPSSLSKSRARAPFGEVCAETHPKHDYDYDYDYDYDVNLERTSARSRFQSMFASSPKDLKRANDNNNNNNSNNSSSSSHPTSAPACFMRENGVNSTEYSTEKPDPPPSFIDMFIASPRQLKQISSNNCASPRARVGSSVYDRGAYTSSSSNARGEIDAKVFDDVKIASPSILNKLRIKETSVIDRLGYNGGNKKNSVDVDVGNEGVRDFSAMFQCSPLKLKEMRESAKNASSSDCYNKRLGLESDRFEVSYLLLAIDDNDAKKITLEICLEQTVELPEALVPEGTWIREHVVGRCEKIDQAAKCLKSRIYAPSNQNAHGKIAFEATVSYHADCAGQELTQLINVIFGNTSIKEDVMVVDVNLPNCVLKDYPGPRFGTLGIRRLIGVHKGPLLMTALKPMGSTADELADFAYKFALGGIDIIKDDHGLADQPYAPFEERVKKCSEAVKRANMQTGRNCLYAPCLNAPAHLVVSRAYKARELGAGAVLMIPGITGLDACRELAGDVTFKLPIIAHPAILGSMLGGGTRQSVRGFSHEILLGVLPRLAGCDMTVFPTFGGRFGFSREECLGIKSGCERSLGSMPSIMVTPGGGMTMERVKNMIDAYGSESLCLLIGGSLYAAGTKDLVENARGFLALAQRTDLYGPFESHPIGYRDPNK